VFVLLVCVSRGRLTPPITPFKLEIKVKETVKFKDVHPLLKKYMLADGLNLVWDYQHSQGNWLVDGVTGRKFLDLFSFFATNPIGHNHPRMSNPETIQRYGLAAIHNPSNSDIYTIEMARFVDTFMSITVPEPFRYLFLISGGALAVENALKTAFDWKVRKNFVKGYTSERGHKVIHFREAFHGRSGYTLSLTNTLPDKILYFPKFDWQRIINPKITFPLEDHREEVIATEKLAVNQIKMAFQQNPDEIAAIIIEPIQAEGGDNHFRPEFLQALRSLADENDSLLIFDEIQTGLGITGSWWAFEQLKVIPDIVAFGKKTQVCGIFATERLDEVKDNVFHVPSRINSTWGGNLIDMMRSEQYIRIINEENLLENSRNTGAYLLTQIQALCAEFSKHLSNPRGRGLMCAITLSSTDFRDKVRHDLFDRGLLVLSCGTQSIRFRPSLTIQQNEIDLAIQFFRATLEKLM